MRWGPLRDKTSGGSPGVKASEVLMSSLTGGAPPVSAPLSPSQRQALELFRRALPRFWSERPERLASQDPDSACVPCCQRCPWTAPAQAALAPGSRAKVNNRSLRLKSPRGCADTSSDVAPNLGNPHPCNQVLTRRFQAHLSRTTFSSPDSIEAQAKIQFLANHKSPARTLSRCPSDQ